MNIRKNLIPTTSYKQCLFSVYPTNHLQTLVQLTDRFLSLISVNANPTKELQNVLPKCNPITSRLCYPVTTPYAIESD